VTVDPDLIVIGGGAAGITAAQAATRGGARVLLVQDGPIGGDCTFTGCVPSKALLSAAGRGDDFEQAMGQVRASVARIAATEDDVAMARQQIAVRHGRARLLGEGLVDIDAVKVRAPRIILATGAGPAVPPIDGLDPARVLTNESLFDLRVQPASLAILGGGPIGCEMAQAFARLGTTVTVVEAMDRLLPGDDPRASSIVAGALVADGVDVHTSAGVQRVEHLDGEVCLHLGDGSSTRADHLLVATGRRASTEALGLDAAGVELDARGFIRTEDTLATTAPGIWAIGDVTGRLAFTHAAAAMALVAATNALSKRARIRPQRFDTSAIPRVTFTDPEVAQVGMTEAEAAHHGGRVATVPFDALDRAITTGRTEGYLDLIVGPRRLLRDTGGGRVLGATVVGPTAGELINEVALAIQVGCFAGRLAQTVHAYPTWSMAIQLAAAQLFFEVDGRSTRPAGAAGSS
jgi:pyruvate/2-oxoglutarate dehydrogenase complex dihydrolipoamide dehydrogenase (E3) component